MEATTDNDRELRSRSCLSSIDRRKMKTHVTPMTEAELHRAFPISADIAGWGFRVEEISAGIYDVLGSDTFRKSVSRRGSDLDALLARCVEDARALQKKEPIQTAETTRGK